MGARALSSGTQNSSTASLYGVKDNQDMASFNCFMIFRAPPSKMREPYSNHLVRLSVRPSVRLSVCLSVCPHFVVTR